MKTHRLRHLLPLFLALLPTTTAMGQARMQFPSFLGEGTVPPPGTAVPGTGSAASTSPQGTVAPPGTTAAPPATGAPTQPAPNYAVPPNFATPPASSTPSTYGQPGATFAQPGATFGQPGAPVNPLAPTLGPQAAPVGPVPGAQFNGVIQPPPATWDPYAPPGSVPPTLLPQDPYLPYQTPAFSTAGALRFLQEARLDYVWMPGSGTEELGLHNPEVHGTFAFPFFHNTQTPLLVTPGFAAYFWEGCIEMNGQSERLPRATYDAYLELGWNPQVTPMFGGELAFRAGVHSDFRHVTTHSIRYQGRGLAVLAFSPNMTVKAGVWYLHRNRIKLLPAGGFVWTPQGPDGNVVFEALFPNPRVAFRLADFQNTEWWLYGRGEYGGGAWTVRRETGESARIDYNDMRAAVGLEFIRPRLSGLFEAGIAFEREIFIVDPPTVDRRRPTIFLRGSVAL